MFFNNLFNNPFAGPAGGFGPGIRIFHNGININSQQFQKPTPIVKTIEIPIDKILSGTTIPVDIERWLIQEGNKVFVNLKLGRE